MVTKKDPQDVTTKTDSEAYDNLYVSMTNPDERRKNLLLGIKNTLVMQGEFEKIMELRKQKHKVLADVKADMEALNSSYQKLKKYLPNVKNVISYTEKELSTLEGNIEMLKSDMVNTKSQASMGEYISENLKDVNPRSVRDLMKDNLLEMQKEKQEEDQKNKPKQKVSRLERIQNNLKVIESKLRDV